jgi:hypothetical protein
MKVLLILSVLVVAASAQCPRGDWDSMQQWPFRYWDSMQQWPMEWQWNQQNFHFLNFE